LPGSLCIQQGFDLCMRQPGPPMPAPPDNFTGPDQHGADRRVGRSGAKTALREPQGLSHEMSVHIHNLHQHQDDDRP
jgi:hypothetical protein